MELSQTLLCFSGNTKIRAFYWIMDPEVVNLFSQMVRFNWEVNKGTEQLKLFLLKPIFSYWQQPISPIIFFPKSLFVVSFSQSLPSPGNTDLPYKKTKCSSLQTVTSVVCNFKFYKCTLKRLVYLLFCSLSFQCEIFLLIIFGFAWFDFPLVKSCRNLFHAILAP